MSSESSPQRTHDENWLPEVQALRALAVTLVLLFHAYPTFVPGGFTGVDIFFVLSGFLITRQILKSQETGSFTFREFFNRRARRLLPAASLVLLVAAIVGYLLRPKTEHWNIVQQLVASTLYVQNWQLAVSEVDYFGSAPTLVQHFWSLSVEEQFYLVWPVLIALGFFLAKKTKRSGRKASLVILSVLTIASLSCAFYFQRTQPELTYFGTHARAWEFAVGALLAHRATRKTSLARFRTSSAVIGFGALLVSAIFLNEERLFPGWALVAVVPSAMVLWFDAPDSTSVFGKALVASPVRYLSDISYSLYLWHWPVLVVARDLGDQPLVPAGALIVSTLLAHATHRFLETPARLTARSTPKSAWYAYGSIATLTLLQLGTSFWVKAKLEASHTRTEEIARKGLAQPKCFGADAMLHPPCKPVFGSEYTPDLVTAAKEVWKLESRKKCFTRRSRSDARICRTGKKDAPKHVFLVGDSHTLHWDALIRELANEMGFRLSISYRASCPFVTRKIQKQDGDSCLAWTKNVKKEIDADPSIDVIVTSAMANKLWVPQKKQDAYETGVAGFVDLWSHFLEQGKEVVVLGDTPLPNPQVHECLSKAPNPRTCGRSRYESTHRLPGKFKKRPDPLGVAAKRIDSPEVHFVDPTDAFCDSDFCPAIVGNVLPYRDSDHMTKVFALTMKPLVLPVLREALE